MDGLSTNQHRPTELRGHTRILSNMLDAAQQDKLHHAWILSGPKGVGKARLALEFAADAIAKLNRKTSLFGDLSGNEGQLQVEKDLVYKWTHPDFLYITSEMSDTNKSGQIRVEQIRKIHQFLANASARGGWRVVIIDSLDEINLNGANALLKILEEPPVKTVILLLASSKASLLPTILSRCRTQIIRALSLEDTLHVLREIYEDADEKYLSQLGLLSSGAPGQAYFLSEANALDAYEQSCQILARHRSELNHIMMLGTLWGEGGAKAAPKRLAGAYLFDRLFAASAVAAVTKTDLSGYLQYEIDAINSLAQDFSPKLLTEFHHDIQAVFQNSTQFYLDAAAVFQPFLLKMHTATIRS